MKVLVAYDGTLHAKVALRYGLEKVRESGGELVALHVFNSDLFIDYDAIPEAEEIARRESLRYIEELEGIIRDEGDGVKARIIVEDGNPEKEILSYAKAENVDILLCPARYKSLVKKSPCRVCIIPGNILVPVENEDSTILKIDLVVKEAKAMHSKVILLGLIPIHIYNKWEKAEIEKIKRETPETIKRIKQVLTEQGIETKDLILSGYPDEEILRVADEYTVSMILFIARGDKPSELNKAVNILLDETNRRKMPILSVHTVKN